MENGLSNEPGHLGEKVPEPGTTPPPGQAPPPVVQEPGIPPVEQPEVEVPVTERPAHEAELPLEQAPDVAEGDDSVHREGLSETEEVREDQLADAPVQEPQPDDEA